MTTSIRRRRVFADLAHRGHRVSHGAVRLTYLDHAASEIPLESTPQVAYALPRRFGSAVERNRARRRLRDAFATSWASSTIRTSHTPTTEPTLRLDGAFLLSGHRGLLTIPFNQLVDDIAVCLDRLASRANPQSPHVGTAERPS